MGKEEAVASTLEDVGAALQTVLDFLEWDTNHLKDMGVQEEAAKFPWDARDRAITEIMATVVGLRNRIRCIEGSR